MSYNNNYGNNGNPYGQPYGGNGNQAYGNPYAQQYNNQEYEMSNVNQGPPPPNSGNQGSEDMMVFFREIDDIKRSLVQYDDNVDRIEALHKRSLGEVDTENQQWTQKQIDGLVEETSSLSQSLKSRIKTLESKSQRDSTKKTQCDNVKEQFKKSIQKYQQVEQQFRARYREAAERQFRIVRPDATDSEVKEAVENSDSQVFAQALMSSNRRGQAQTALTEVQNRHREIEKIEKTMTELATLFHDMEVLVAEQEAPVQHIDEQATQVQTDIEQGVGHTNRAIKSARAARKKKWWCLGIIVIILIIVAIVLGVKLSN